MSLKKYNIGVINNTHQHDFYAIPEADKAITEKDAHIKLLVRHIKDSDDEISEKDALLREADTLIGEMNIKRDVPIEVVLAFQIRLRANMKVK